MKRFVLAILLIMPALPAETIAAFEAAEPLIVLPAGRWTVSQSLAVQPGTQSISGHDCTLVPETPMPLRFVSPINAIGGTYNWIQHHATGAITPGVDTLSLPQPIDFSVGETVMCRLGVRPEDPNEPVLMIFRTVAAVSATSVTFSEPFSVSIPVYGTPEALVAVVPLSQQNKVGDFGTVTESNWPGRGYGDDHELIRLHGVVSDVTLDGLTIEWPADYKPNGAASVWCQFARNIAINNINVVNPRGKTVHVWGTNATVDGLTIRGDGYNLVFNTVPWAATAITGWGGEVDVTDLDVDAANCNLWSFEIGTKATFDGVKFRGTQPHDFKASPFITAPGSDPVYCKNGRFDFTGTNYIFASAAPVQTFEDCEFVRPLSHFMNFDQVAWVGSVRIGGRRFRPAKRGKWTLVIPPDDTFGELELPAGIYRSGTITVSSHDRISGIRTPDAAPAFNGLTAPFIQNRWLNLPPGFPDRSAQYRTTLRAFTTEGAEPLTITVEAEFLPEQQMALLDDLNLSHGWPLDEFSDGSGPVTRRDAVGSADLTDNNTVPSIADGPFGRACRFTSANSESLSASDAPGLTLGGTFACWFRIPAATTESVGGKDVSGQREWSATVGSGAVLRQDVWNPAGSNIGTVLDVVAITANVWHLGFWQHDSANQLIVVQLDDNAATTAARSLGVADGTADFRLGAHATAFGDIDIGPAYMSPDAWTSEQRADLWNGGAGVDLFSSGDAGARRRFQFLRPISNY